jgi:electron transfer flavoprotein alpha subunit
MAPLHDFRLRFTRSPRDSLNVDDHEIALPTVNASHEVALKARENGQPMKDATSIVLSGTGWESQEKAIEMAAFYADILSRTYARLRLAADFGWRPAKSCFTVPAHHL